MSESASPRRHRGLHPQDARLFGRPEQIAALRAAAGALEALLGRGYALDAALKLVGDRHGLRARQRLALQRMVWAPAVAAARRSRRLAPEAVRGGPLAIDGFNQVITVEVALSGGVLLRGGDGALRDLASVHGTYRQVRETPRAVEALGAWLAARGVAPVMVYLDAPVSNSGRIAAVMRELAAGCGWPWTVELVPNADAVLKRDAGPVASSDAAVLDAGVPWLDLAGAVVAEAAPAARALTLIGPWR